MDHLDAMAKNKVSKDPFYVALWDKDGKRDRQKD